MTSRFGHGIGPLLLLAVLLWTCAPAPEAPIRSIGQPATVVTVVDGDTIELADGRAVRYIGINAPEMGQPFYEEARQANRALVEGRSVVLTFDAEATDRFGRVLAYVWAGGRLVNQELLRRGYATVYTQPPNVRYSSELEAAELEARTAQVGLWQPAQVRVRIATIHFNAPGPDDQNPNGEWLVLRNDGPHAADLTGFMLKDEATHVYTFPQTSLGPGRTLRLYSGRGTDGSDARYWGLTNDAVWGNDGDTAYLWDTSGHLVDTYRYP